jgi:hypothetical protein
MRGKPRFVVMAFHYGSDRLHPQVYAAIAALTLWLVVSAWLFFASGAYTSLALAIVTGLLSIAVALPFVMSRVGYGLEDAEHRHDQPRRFREWASGDFDAWQTHLAGREAALQALLPIAAVAFGMTLFGLAFFMATPAGGG